MVMSIFDTGRNPRKCTGMGIPAGRESEEGNTYLLINTALEIIRDPSIAPGREVGLNNVYRMLETYRVGGLKQDDDTTGIHDSFEKVLENIFPHKDKDQAIGKIEDVLRGLTYPNDFKFPSKGDRRITEVFFSQLHEEFRI